MPKVAIIIPVYKVEKYLRRCVDSVLNQTLRDISVILVDDGSPDQCPAICDEYAAKDSRVHVIHQENIGQSGARDAGLNYLYDDKTGDAPEYVGFVDSDDYIDSDMYEKMYVAACNTRADVVKCDSVRETGSIQTPQSKAVAGEFYDEQRIKAELYPQLIMKEEVDFGPLLSVWCCLYRYGFMQHHALHFDPKVKLSEDCLFNALAGLHAKRAYYMKGFAPYHYIYNPTSNSNTYKPFAWTSFCRMNDEFRRLFADSDYDFSRQFDLHMLYFTLNYMGQLSRANFSWKERYRLRRDCLNNPRVRKAMKNFKIPDCISWKLKIIVFLVKYNCPLALSIIGG